MPATKKGLTADIFYGPDPQLEAIATHRARGERALFVRDGQIVLAQGMQEAAVIALASMKPAKAGKPDMLMAAVAAAWALGIDPELIAAGLRAFESDLKKQN